MRATLNGEFIAAGGGTVQRLVMSLSQGLAGDDLSVEDIAFRLDELLDPTGAVVQEVGRFVAAPPKLAGS